MKVEAYTEINKTLDYYSNIQVEMIKYLQKNCYATKLLYKVIERKQIFKKLNKVDFSLAHGVARRRAGGLRGSHRRHGDRPHAGRGATGVSDAPRVAWQEADAAAETQPAAEAPAEPESDAGSA